MFWLEFRLMKINENPIGLNQLVQLENNFIESNLINSI